MKTFLMLLFLLPIPCFGQTISYRLQELDSAFAQAEYNLVKSMNETIQPPRTEFNIDNTGIAFLRTAGSF